MCDRFLERRTVARASRTAKDSGDNYLKIAGSGVRNLPPAGAGAATQPPQNKIPDLGARNRSVPTPLFFVFPLLVARRPVHDRDAPGFQSVLVVVRHCGMSVTVVEMKTGRIAREPTDRPLGPRRGHDGKTRSRH